jgi:hypothetical protein
MLLLASCWLKLLATWFDWLDAVLLLFWITAAVGVAVDALG